MAKRSPILGYNHNLQYRGVVFHVQTEDSGIINPHIFTHLFHAGVIVNTRKLVYDPDADDGVVKALMQAQHKAVLRELRRGLFDDKIDVYLVAVPTLLPRGSNATVAENEEASRQAELVVELTDKKSDATDDVSKQAAVAVASASDNARDLIVSMDPLADLSLDETRPAILVPAAVLAPASDTESERAAAARKPGVPPPIPPRTGSQGRPAGMFAPPVTSGPPTMPKANSSTTNAAPRTSSELGNASAVVPGSDAVTIPSPGFHLPSTRPSQSNLTAAAHVVVSRGTAGSTPVATVDENDESENSPVEVYAPPLPGDDDRPGSYAQHRKRDAEGRLISGTGPISLIPDAAASQPIKRHPTLETLRGRAPAPIPTPPGMPRVATPPALIPMPPQLPAAQRTSTEQPEPRRTRADTAPRIAPITTRNRPATGGSSSGVVMSRPAVIIGGSRSATIPAVTRVPSPARTTTPAGKVRKARVDSSRGVFGQDLISEKSLDEVILAYLSEDGNGEGGDR